jgi:hypothetical protein
MLPALEGARARQPAERMEINLKQLSGACQVF